MNHQQINKNELLIEALTMLRNEYKARAGRAFHSGVTLAKGGKFPGLIMDNALTKWRAKVTLAEKLLDELNTESESS